MTMMRVADQSGHYMRVRQMMKAFGQDTPEAPTTPDDKIRILRARLILEEALETIEKGLGVTVCQSGERLDFDAMSFMAEGEFDMVETVDGCGDISVVTTGTLIACGVPDEPVLLLIDENNLEKIANGRVNPQTGKFEKHPDHRPPNVAGLLEDLTRRVYDRRMTPRESQEALEAVRRSAEAGVPLDAVEAPQTAPGGPDGSEAAPAPSDAGAGRVGD